MTTKKINFDADARARGLTRVGHELWLVPDKPIKFTNALPVRTSQSVAACAALNLTYWSDHPVSDMVWATDFQGRFHEVRLDRKTQTSAHFCGRSTRFTPEGKVLDTKDCSDAGKTASWQTAVTPQALCEQLNGEWTNYVEPSKLTAAERRTAKARNEAKAAQRDAEIDDLIQRSYEKIKATKPPRRKAAAPKVSSTDSEIDQWADALAAEILGEQAS